LNRTNLAQEISGKRADQTVIEFDHHPKIDHYAELEIKQPELSSTAEVLYHFFRTNQLKIDKTLANCILTGLVTDTANFFHDSTSESTLRIASEMLLAGARFPAILQNTWRNKSLPTIKLWGEAINNLNINHAYHLAVSILTYAKLKDYRVPEDEMIGLPAFLSNLHGVNALLLLREEAPGLIKGNLRTAQDGPDISLLAQLLGGGGHPKASGFVLDFKLEKTDGRWEIT
ncbi:MAG: DHH family phosphoesterase, partial [Planctomycetes bacterium]|nr:DHH family phosphoesterase [Planctomycetota bacterium]